jgi:hypothetical protein
MKMSGKNFDKKVIKEKELIISYYIDFAPTSLKTAFLEKKIIWQNILSYGPNAKNKRNHEKLCFLRFSLLIQTWEVILGEGNIWSDH